MCSSINRWLAIAVAVVAFADSPLRACSCGGSLRPTKSMARADAVFTGKVVKLETVRPGKEDAPLEEVKATVQVIRSVKGQAKKTVVVMTGTGGGDCGYPFEEGESYLFYCGGHRGIYGTNICARTQSLEGAKEEIEELLGRRPKIPESEPPPEVSYLGTLIEGRGRIPMFVVRNTLHQRIFCEQHPGVGLFSRFQVLRDGTWQDVPLGYTDETAPEKVTADLKAEAAARKAVEQESFELEKEEPSIRERSYSWLHWKTARTDSIYSAPRTKLPWRVGLVYLTEAEFDSGKRFNNDGHVLWGPATTQDTLKGPEFEFDKVSWGERLK